MWTFGVVLCTLVSFILAAPLDETIKVQVTVHDVEQLIDEHGSTLTSQQFIIGDIEIDKNRNIIDLKWPGGIIPYIISANYSDNIQSTITTAMREIESDVNGQTDCVKFIPRTNELNYLEIYPGVGCHTVVGMVNTGRHVMSIGPGCEFRGIIMHELVHVLGFSHEHSRLDRDNYININVSNIRETNMADFDKVATVMLDILNSSYDFSSIMHYGPYKMAKDTSVPVITPKPGLAAGVRLGQRMALSISDVARLQRYYNCQEDTTHITRTYITDSLLSCYFENDICNFTQGSRSTLPWAVAQGTSGAGPLAGNTNGADSYLLATEQVQNATSRLLTPAFRDGPICISFFRFQKGPQSYLNVIATGPKIPRTVIKTFQDEFNNEWKESLISLNVPVGAVFRIIFEAVISSGDVAIDDVDIYKGQCL